MNLDYKQKEDIMQKMFVMHNSPIGFRSVTKAYRFTIMRESSSLLISPSIL